MNGQSRDDVVATDRRFVHLAHFRWNTL
jgi:hypothetical protein